MEDIKKVKVINGVCTAVSIGCAVATPILVAQAQNKAKAYIDHYELHDLTMAERVKYTWKYYIPSAVVLGIGIGANITMGVVSNKLTTVIGDQIANTVLEIAAQTELKDALTEKIKDKYGEKTAQVIKDMSAQTVDEFREKHNPITLIESSTTADGAGTQLCDDTHGRYFRGTIEEVKAAVNEVNALIIKGQEMNLSDIYDFLGLPNGSIDRSLTPIEGQLFELDWGSSIYNGQPCAHFGFKRLVATESY